MSFREDLLRSFVHDEYINDGVPHKRVAKPPPQIALSWQGDTFAEVMEAAPQRLGPGQILSSDRGNTSFNTGAGGVNMMPGLSLRLKPTLGDNYYILPESVTVWMDANESFRVALFLDPTIAGSDAVSWVDVENSHAYEGSDARVQMDKSRNNTNLLSAGTQVYSDYGIIASNVATFNLNGLSFPLEPLSELVVGINNIVSANRDYLIALRYRLLVSP